MNDDAELLRRYADERSEPAFAEFVRRHLGLVYAAALRRIHGDEHRAAEIAQQVFTTAARRATALAHHDSLSGWLYTATRNATLNLLRDEQRRRTREHEAQAMNELLAATAPEADWNQLRPVLDAAMDELSGPDREAVLLRFFEGRPFADVGSKLHLTENAARMRVERALDKLRALLARRGITSTTAALALALANQTSVAIPAGLAASVTGAALADANAAVAASAWTTLMSMTKLQIGITSVLAVAGATGFVMQAETNAALRQEAAALRAENAAIAPLQAENLKLARSAAEVADLRQDDAKLSRLGDAAMDLKGRLQPMAQAAPAAAPAAGDTYDISKLDQAPRPKFQPRPQYPDALRAAGVEGQVVVDLVVDRDGNVQNAFAAKSSQPEFAAAALAAVNQWKFNPGRKDGRDVNTHMLVPIEFSLNKKPGGGAFQVDGK